MRTLRIAIVLSLGLAACASTPKTVAGQASLEQQASATLRDMTARDPSLDGVLAKAPGYVVFPSVGKGALVVGGSGGQGVLYVGGQATGMISLREVSIGAQAGGQSFAELVVLNDPNEIQKIQSGTYALDASVSAVALQSGAAASANLTSPVSVFVMPRGGLMVEASVAGQNMEYHPIR